MSGGPPKLLPVFAVLAFLALTLTSAASHSGTFDEGVYVSAGYTSWRFGDYRVNTTHPPLAKLLAGAPLLLLDVRADPTDGAFLEAHAWKLARRFVYEWNEPRRLLFWARVPMAALAAALVLLVWACARRHFGPSAGALALLLAALNPDLLAHGSLATTDLPVTAFAFASVAAFERLLARPSASWLLAAGAATGAALLSKHTALLLLPLLFVLAVAHALPGEKAIRRRSVLRGLLLLVLSGAVAYVVLWAGYRFRYDASAEGVQGEPLLWRAGDAWLRSTRLLPEAYAHGLADLFARSQDRRAFLFGHYSNEGWWFYFPVTFLLKTPLPLLVLLAAAARATREARLTAAFVWLPAAAFGLAALASKVDIGHRYLLPTYPFLIVAAAGAAPALLERGRRARALLLVLCGWYAAGTALNHPHHLAYFNELAGGPSQGYKWLADSNVDWGQDLIRLKRYMDEQRLPSVKLSYFGTAAPEAYGIRHELLPSMMRPFPERVSLLVRPGDVVVISATNLQGVYLPRPARRLMERFREQQPIARVGRSLFVYRAEFAWLLRPEFAQELGWLDDATLAYREALRLDPNDATAREYLERADALR